MDYTFCGAAAKLHRDFIPDPDGSFPRVAEEYLLDGPAGTGKTVAILALIHNLMIQYPGARWLLARYTRVSLSQSTLVTFEQKVLGPARHLFGSAGRANRASYVYPNGSEIVLMGLDEPTRTYSTEFDGLYVNEATELNEGPYEELHRSLRHNIMPFQPAILDCNPSTPSSWLNKRPHRPGSVMRRYPSRHWHNPWLYDPITKQWTDAGRKYLAKLERLSGPRRARLYLGQWTGAEGMMWETFDAHRHVVHRGPKSLTRPHGANLPPFEWLIAGVDWGFSRAGVFQLWGVSGRSVKTRKMTLIMEIYRAKQTIEWWANEIAKVCSDPMFRPKRIICDSADPGHIRMLNDRLSYFGGRDIGRIATGADKQDRRASIDLVRQLFAEDRISICSDALVDRCPIISEEERPCGLIEEIPGYVVEETREGLPPSEDPDPNCDDHSCDTARYVAVDVFRKDYSEPKTRGFARGSMGARYGVPE